MVHELLTTQLVVDVLRQAGSRDDLRLLHAERRYFRRPLGYAVPGGVPRLVPDADLITARPSARTPSGHTVLWHAVETNLRPRHGGDVARWRRKLAAYERWLAGPAERFLLRQNRRWGVVPRRPNWRPPWRLLVVTHDPHRGHDFDGESLLELLTVVLDDAPAELRRAIWLTTAAELERHDGGGASPLAFPVWVRARDAPDPREVRRQGTWAAKRDLVAWWLEHLPRRALFPPLDSRRAIENGAKPGAPSRSVGMPLSE